MDGIFLPIIRSYLVHLAFDVTGGCATSRSRPLRLLWCTRQWMEVVAASAMRTTFCTSLGRERLVHLMNTCNVERKKKGEKKEKDQFDHSIRHPPKTKTMSTINVKQQFFTFNPLPLRTNLTHTCIYSSCMHACKWLNTLNDTMHKTFIWRYFHVWLASTMQWRHTITTTPNPASRAAWAIERAPRVDSLPVRYSAVLELISPIPKTQSETGKLVPSPRRAGMLSKKRRMDRSALILVLNLSWRNILSSWYNRDNAAEDSLLAIRSKMLLCRSELRVEVLSLMERSRSFCWWKKMLSGCTCDKVDWLAGAGTGWAAAAAAGGGEVGMGTAPTASSGSHGGLPEGRSIMQWIARSCFVRYALVSCRKRALV